MRLEEVLKQNYMGFILRLRDDEKKYDHFEWFAKGRFEEVFNTVKQLAVYDAMLTFNENWKDNMDWLLTSCNMNMIEVDIISHFSAKNANIILNSEEGEFRLLRDYIRRAFSVRLWRLGHEMNKRYNSMRDAIKNAKCEEELKKNAGKLEWPLKPLRTVNTMFYMEVQRDKLKMPIMNIIIIAMIIHKLNGGVANSGSSFFFKQNGSYNGG